MSTFPQATLQETGRVSGYVKMGLLVGGAIIVATAIWIYFSPYHVPARPLRISRPR